MFCSDFVEQLQAYSDEMGSILKELKTSVPDDMYEATARVKESGGALGPTWKLPQCPVIEGLGPPKVC